MKRFSIAVSCFLIFFVTYDAFAQDTQTLVLPTGTMTLAVPEGADREAKRSPVLFPHSLHFSYSCKECHHKWDGAQPVQSCATSGCHEKLWASPPGTTPDNEPKVKSLTGAYHQVCRDCHREELKAQKARGTKEVVTGPIACEGCHPDPHSDVVNSEESLSIPLGNLTIKAPEGVEAKRGDVKFPHGEHFEFACQSCHHDWDGESEVESCTSCHDEVEPSGSRNIKDPANVMYYLAAYHNVCLDCHRDTESQRKAAIKAAEKQGKSLKEETLPKAGPVGCLDCHT